MRWTWGDTIYLGLWLFFGGFFWVKYGNDGVLLSILMGYSYLMGRGNGRP